MNGDARTPDGSRSPRWRNLFDPVHDLRAFIVPGADVARARGLDLASAGLRVVATPRHANLLVLVGPLPHALRRAAVVVHHQMPAPRAVLSAGIDDRSVCHRWTSPSG